jgi:hypothetical protein
VERVGVELGFDCVVQKLLLSVVLLSACSKGTSADLQHIKQARSIAAEWALINEQAQVGKLTPTYVGSMHEWLRDDLKTTIASLSEPNSPYGDQMKALLAKPPGAAASDLRGRAEALKRIEDSLESA